MAQSQRNLGVLEPFYGWYKQVMGKLIIRSGLINKLAIVNPSV